MLAVLRACRLRRATIALLSSAAAEMRAERDVGAEAETNGVFEQGARLVDVVSSRSARRAASSWSGGPTSGEW